MELDYMIKSKLSSMSKNHMNYYLLSRYKDLYQGYDTVYVKSYNNGETLRLDIRRSDYGC